MQYTFADRLLKARTSAGKTQTELAAALKTSASRICEWEQGRSEPSSIVRIETIAKFLGVSPAWLAFGDSRPINRR